VQVSSDAFAHYRGDIRTVSYKAQHFIATSNLRNASLGRRKFHFSSNVKNLETPNAFKRDPELLKMLDELSIHGPGDVLTLASVSPDLYRSEEDLIHSTLHCHGSKIYANIARYEPDLCVDRN
jgi:hypothetical protein